MNQLLPAFISTCLSQLDSHVSTGKPNEASGALNLSEPVFQSFCELLPRYPSLFCPYLSKIQPLLLTKIGTLPNSDPSHVLACTLFVLLHHSAPKNTPVIKWSEACAATVAAIHRTADELFRAVLEDWDDPNRDNRVRPRSNYSQEIQGAFEEPVKLPDWIGVFEGADRLRSLLGLLRSFLTVTTSEAMPLAISRISACLSRLMNLVVPTSEKPLQTQMRINADISRLEREELFALLPSIHLAALRTMMNMFESLGDGTLPVIQILLDQALHVFEAEQAIADIRAESYRILGKALPFWGSSAPKHRVGQFTVIVLSCCQDIMHQRQRASQSARSTQNSHQSQLGNGTASMNAGFFWTTSLDQSSSNSSSVSPARQAALDLLPLLLTHLPARHMSPALREKLDRTAILARHKEALLASVLNPMPSVKKKTSTPSVMPFFSRICQGDLLAEGVLRPRMPVIPFDLGNVEEDGIEEPRSAERKELRDEPWYIYGASKDREDLNEDSLDDETADQGQPAAMDEPDLPETMNLSNGVYQFAADGAQQPSEPLVPGIGASSSSQFVPGPHKRIRDNDKAIVESLGNAAELSLDADRHQLKRLRLEQSTTEGFETPEIRTSSSIVTKDASSPDLKGKGKAVAVDQAEELETSGAGVVIGGLLHASVQKDDMNRGIGDDDDDSEFEIPVINTEMDTEDEDEDETGIYDEVEDAEDETGDQY